MDNQHRKISGYRELTQAEIDLMNEIKGKGVELGELVHKLERMNHSNANTVIYLGSAIEELGEARAWVQEGKMQLKKGLMSLTRAVAKPTFF